MSAQGKEPARPAAGPGGPPSPRPHVVAAVVPAASVPLAFLIAAAPGLVGCGVVLAWASRPGAADPTADPVVAAAHLGMLATLSMGVLGALHHLTPVIAAGEVAAELIRIAEGTPHGLEPDLAGPGKKTCPTSSAAT